MSLKDWKDAKLELPISSGDYLILCDGYHSIAYYNPEHVDPLWHNDNGHAYPDYWMELPEIPKDK